MLFTPVAGWPLFGQNVSGRKFDADLSHYALREAPILSAISHVFDGPAVSMFRVMKDSYAAQRVYVFNCRIIQCSRRQYTPVTSDL